MRLHGDVSLMQWSVIKPLSDFVERDGKRILRVHNPDGSVYRELIAPRIGEACFGCGTYLVDGRQVCNCGKEKVDD
jgi:hypothetical protein